MTRDLKKLFRIREVKKGLESRSGTLAITRQIGTGIAIKINLTSHSGHYCNESAMSHDSI
jgi:hypothetical protein